MTLEDLRTMKCVPCEGGVPKLTREESDGFLRQVDGWSLEGDERIRKTFTFRDFVTAMAFLNEVAGIAEGEGHHPDFCVHWNKVDFSIWTHAIGGLSRNDFILAAKIDAAAPRHAGPATNR